MQWYFQVFCSIFSGALLALAIPNELIKWGSPLIGLISIVPLYLACAHSKSFKQTFFNCALQAFVCHILSSFWLGNFHGFALFTLGASAGGTFVFHGLFALFYHFPYSRSTNLQSLCSKMGKESFLIPFRVLWFSAVYTVWEWCKSNGFLGYPWGTISMTAYKWPLITQLADITGTYGITFLFVFFSATLAEGLILIKELPNTFKKEDVLQAYRLTARLLAVLLLSSVFYGAVQKLLPRTVTKKVNAVLVQQNLDPWGDTDEEAIEISCSLTEEKIAEFKAEDEDTDVVVWSEAVLAKYFPTAERYYSNFPTNQPLIPFIKKQKTPFIIGAPLTIDRNLHKFGNSTVLIDKNGKYQGAYVKMHLVPFAERIPGVEYEWVRDLIKKIAGFSYGWTQGEKAVVYELPLSTSLLADTSNSQLISLADYSKNQKPKTTVIVGTPICFDDAFGEVCRKLFLAGSELFINLTNDSWSRTESSEIQHFVVSHYRAIEYRTTLARSTNGGFTCVVDPTGKVLDSLPLFEQAALKTSIPVYERKMTIYARFGDWLPKLYIFLIFAFIASVILWEKDHPEGNIETSLIRKRGRPRKNAPKY